MPISPPANLAALLERLKLATADEIAAVSKLASRLAGDLPDFESVWVDALAQARVLTPYQAAEINAGRASDLELGPYVILRPIAASHIARVYLARDASAKRTVRLYVVPAPQLPLAETIAGLDKLVAAGSRGSNEGLIEKFGSRGTLIWAACGDVDATSAAWWLVENGRFDPRVVLEIARQMVSQLQAIAEHGIVHGDLGAAGLWLSATGEVHLPGAGLRGIVRPHEGYSFGDLPPAAYDYLSPERIADGAPPTLAGDLYACGCLWWHLLTGRTPLGGGDSLGKLKAAHAGRIADVRQLAPTAPDRLVRAIAACLSRDPAARPTSFAQLAEQLGPSTGDGRSRLSRAIGHPAPLWQIERRAVTSRKRKLPRAVAAAGTAVALCALALAPLLVKTRGAGPSPVASAQNPSPQAKPFPEPAAAPPEVLATPGIQPSAPTHNDPQVRPAAATLPLADEDLLADIVLPAGQIVDVEQLELKPHIRVRGPAGQRPLVRVPRRGLLIDCEDVRFEGIDFIAAESGDANRAMLILAAQTVTLDRCSFTSMAGDPPAAIAFAGSADHEPGLGGEIVLENCVCDGLRAVVEEQSQHGLTVRLRNTLCVAAGPIVRLDHWPADTSRVEISLQRVTTRGDTAIIDCRRAPGEGSPGVVRVTASECALATAARGGLVIFSGSDRPDSLVRALEWTGEGSIVTPHTAMVLWRPPGMKPQALSEDELQVAGLVRSEVQFAAPAGGPPEASRVMQWQVPLRSPDAPGADPTALARPDPSELRR